MGFYRGLGGAIVEMDPPNPKNVHAVELFEASLASGALVPVLAVRAVTGRHGGIVWVEDLDATPPAPSAPAPAPAPTAQVVEAVAGSPVVDMLGDDGPPSDEKAALLAALEAKGATNMATLRRYSADRLREELAKLEG